MGLKVKPHLYVALDERGFRIGETHHNATVTDAQVERIRDLYEYENWNVAQISEHLGISKNTIIKIVRYERRISTPHRWRRINGTKG